MGKFVKLSGIKGTDLHYEHLASPLLQTLHTICTLFATLQSPNDMHRIGCIRQNPSHHSLTPAPSFLDGSRYRQTHSNTLAHKEVVEPPCRRLA